MSLHNAAAAWIEGCKLVARAPALVILMTLATALTALPFALVVGERVQASLDTQPPIDLTSEEIDADWWLEFVAQARGIERLFTPAIVGAAALITTITTIVDRPSLARDAIVPLAAAWLVWAFCWGGILNRFANHGVASPSFWSASRRAFPRLAIIGLVALAASALVLIAARPAVMQIAGAVGGLGARLAAFAVIGVLLVAVNLVADYARIFAALRGDAAMRAIGGSAGFLARHTVAAMVLYLITGLVFIVMAASYTAIDLNSGNALGGWRAVIIGQAVVVARIVLRLLFAASEIALVRRLGALG